MRRMSYAEKAREWVVDYSAARAKAIEWLGDRYLLARPVKRRSAGQSGGEVVPPGRRCAPVERDCR